MTMKNEQFKISGHYYVSESELIIDSEFYQDKYLCLSILTGGVQDGIVDVSIEDAKKIIEHITNAIKNAENE